MALGLHRLCQEHLFWPQREASELLGKDGTLQRVCPMRTTRGAFLKPWDREEVTGDVSSTLVQEAEPSSPVLPWPPTCREAWGSNLLLCGLGVPIGKMGRSDIDLCSSNGVLFLFSRFLKQNIK